MKRNIVLIMVDQMRHDALHFLGRKGVKTPNLDRLAREGICFTNMYCQSPVCVPARASMLSGKYVFQHRVNDNTQLLPECSYSFAADLKKNGYVTVAVGRTHHIDNGYTVVPVPIRDSFEFNTEKYPFYGISDFYSDRILERTNSSMDIRATETACEFLEDLSLRQPFCLHLGLLAPHNPFALPEPYASMYDPETIDIPEKLQIADIPPMLAGKYSRQAKITEKELREATAFYYGMITLVDDCVGMIVDKLKKLGLYDNTLLIFVSDHGDMIGERRLYGKTLPYEGSVRVPCIIRDSEIFKGGRVMDQITEQIDITATILEYACVEKPNHIPARSLIPLVLNETAVHREYAFSEMPDWKMIRDSQYKFVLYKDGYCELYDMKNDPQETTSLCNGPGYRDVREEMLKKLVLHFINHEEAAKWLFPNAVQAPGAFRSGIGN